MSRTRSLELTPLSSRVPPAAWGTVLRMSSGEKELAKQLENVPLFAGLKTKNRALIARLGKTVSWADGKVGVKEGSNASMFFLILDGAVDVTQNGKKVNALGPGDYFGEIALLSGGKRTATCTATAPTTLFAIGRPALTPAIASNSDFAMDLTQTMAARQADDQA